MIPNKKAEKPEKGGPVKKEPPKPIIIAVIVFLILVIVGLLFWISIIHKESKTLETRKTTEKKTAVKKPEQNMMHLRQLLYEFDPFFVTLSGSTQEKVFLKIGISAGLSSTELQLEIENKLPVLRRSIFQLLSSMTEKEINDLDGKAKLKKEITAKLNQMLSRGVVKDVYFSQFVVK